MSCGVPRAGDDPPSKQRGWHHSAQVVVWYEANDLSCATFGIAYYHYRAPFEKQPLWIDFSGHANGRTPTWWWPAPIIPNKP